MKWKYDDHFVGLTYEVLDDMKDLSPVAKLIVLRLMVEYRNEGGRNNGDLIVTTAQLREWCAAGQRTVLNAIKEIGEFRHIKLKRGKPGVVGYGQANRFGLRWMPKVGVDVPDPKATTRQVVSSNPGTKKRGSGPSVVVLLDTTSVVVPHSTTTVENSNSGCVKEMPENIEVHGSPENHYLESSNPENSSGTTRRGPGWKEDAA